MANELENDLYSVTTCAIVVEGRGHGHRDGHIYRHEYRHG